MRSDPRLLQFRFLGLVVGFCCLSFMVAGVCAEQVVVSGQTITTPPCGQATQFAHLQRRDNGTSCSFGSCAGTCLSQGAFCCNPGGTSFTPNWICDNGACITSVRGDTGVVDCYDPDNPSGTTQSCIDFKPTTTCYSTDRCYTCSSDQPYCFWQTWVASNSPTLRWFSCIETKQPDATYLAATITAPPSTTSSSTSSHTSTSATSASPTSSTTSSSSSTSASSSTSSAPPVASSSPVLTTGAIIGISVGGAAFLIALLAILIYCIRSRKPSPQGQQMQQNTLPSLSYQSPVVELATPVHYPNSLAGSGSQATATEGDWRYHSQGSHPNLAQTMMMGGAAGGLVMDERWFQKTRMPTELPVQSQVQTPRTENRELYQGSEREGEGGYDTGDEIGVARGGSG